LDDDAIELGRIVKEWVPSPGDERSELALYDLESTRVVACEHVEHRSRRFTYASSVGITDGRGREVGNLVRGRSRWEIRIQDLSGQLLATIKPRLRAPTSFAIKDSTGTEVGNVHASPAVLKYELGDPRGGVERLAASVEVTINGSAASDLRLAVLGFAIHLLDLTGGVLKARSRVGTSQRVERGPLRRLVDAAPALVFAVFVLLFIIAINKAEPADLFPTTKDAASEQKFTRPLVTETSGVWLVPLGEPRRVNLTALADELARRYRIPVTVLPDIALPRWTLDARRDRLVGDQLIRLLGDAYRAQSRAAIIGITDYEMYGGSEFRDDVFSWREPTHYAVVSTSPLGADALDLLRHGHTRHVRTRKLVARNIGFLYYRRLEVDDSHSLLRPSMNGVGDIDKLNEAL
jgi:hypothetical protein